MTSLWFEFFSFWGVTILPRIFSVHEILTGFYLFIYLFIGVGGGGGRGVGKMYSLFSAFKQLAAGHFFGFGGWGVNCLQMTVLH